MKIKIKITGGKVHGVGYRPWLTDVAVNAGLHGFMPATVQKERILLS